MSTTEDDFRYGEGRHSTRTTIPPSSRTGYNRHPTPGGRAPAARRPVECRPTRDPEPRHTLAGDDPVWVPTRPSADIRRSLKQMFMSGALTISPDGICRLGVLGKRTSSEEAARNLVNRMPTGVRFEFVPFRSFEELLVAVKDQKYIPRVDLAIVPHAAQPANRFYMSSELFPALVFPYYTPAYGLASRVGQGAPVPGSTIALYAVTRPVLQALIPDFASRHLQLAEATDTGDAAAMVARGMADYCITNAEAMQHYGLAFVALFGIIPMTWTAFARRADVGPVPQHKPRTKTDVAYCSASSIGDPHEEH